VLKFLLNILVQISKALVNSKIQFLFQKEFLFSSSPLGPAAPSACSAFWPTWPTRPLLPPSAPKQGSAAAASQRCPDLARHGAAAPSTTQHLPAISPPPLLIPRIKHHLKSSHFIPIYHRPFLCLHHRPPPPHRPLYKGRALPSSIAPLPVLLLFSPHTSATCTERHHHRLFTIVTRSPLCRPRLGEARDGFPMQPPFQCTTADEPPCPGEAAKPSSGEPLQPAMAQSTVDQCRSWCTSHGLSPP
jgi:hypothetical protein